MQSKTNESDAYRSIASTRKIDEQMGIPQPVPPLIASAEAQIWSTFFQVHPDLADSPELRTALEGVLRTNGGMRLLNQNLDLALDILKEEFSTSTNEAYVDVTFATHGDGSRIYRYYGTDALEVMFGSDPAGFSGERIA